MKIAARIFTGLVALIHGYIMLLETVLWKTRGLEVFQMTLEQAEVMETMAFNQGWYNGVLAAGLVWSFFIKDARWSRNVSYFFLIAVFVMGIVGALSTGLINVIFVQTIPATIAMIFVFLAGRREV